jgi:hypothetical protein
MCQRLQLRQCRWCHLIEVLLPYCLPLLLAVLLVALPVRLVLLAVLLVLSEGLCLQPIMPLLVPSH